MLGVFERTFNLVKTALKLRSYKHSLLASNIANVDTPGYRRKDISFEKVIQSYLSERGGLKTTHPQHLKGFRKSLKELIKTYEEESLGTPNNVNLEEELVQLTENQMLYEATLQALSKELERLREAITEGGR
ncbi:MAG: flagellar basal body rod protein FlgB [Thermodesulfobacterium geofontis]|uniref:Flagellar basal body rod protein FlgB n=1 Tax=Thermodesulfobacterium geofontis TaxID=1295609 RepID=A0A2N7PPM9_9BACT|nr:MAG: flagellar basal body rod protein FlgB [Thermodesulfobacterium geofontis]PMP97351.1 MAG: flagellar basal body rod protein FlgB [Thermodesulfobacterium geofontis]